jgi:hypothetical protein
MEKDVHESKKSPNFIKIFFDKVWALYVMREVRLDRKINIRRCVRS